MVTGNSAHSGSGASNGNALICFARGTMISTPNGERRVEHLVEGDMVLTLDNGVQPIRWTGSRTVRASGALAPVRFLRGTIGNDRDLLVSPQHRMLLSSQFAPGRFDREQVLAPARALVDDFRVSVIYGGMVSYHHIMFDRHQVVIANGAPSESFHPGGLGLDTLEAHALESLFKVFPDLRADTGAYGPVSRPCLNENETRRLATG
jgi:hypothetical protein